MLDDFGGNGGAPAGGERLCRFEVSSHDDDHFQFASEGAHETARVAVSGGEVLYLGTEGDVRREGVTEAS